MKVESIRHFGIQTTNLSKTISFYKKLGLKLIYKKTEDWTDIFGVLKIAKLQSPDGSIIEFIEDKHTTVNPSYHICFGVKNLDQIYKKLKKYFFVKPRMSPDNSVYLAFCKDCNDMNVELVEIK